MPDRFLRYWATTRVGQVASHLFNDLFENDENRSEEEYYESISRVPGGSKRIHRKRVELENDCIAQIFTRIGTETNQIKNAMVFFNALGISDQVSDATNNGQNQAAAFFENHPEINTYIHFYFPAQGSHNEISLQDKVRFSYSGSHVACEVASLYNELNFTHEDKLVFYGKCRGAYIAAAAAAKLHRSGRRNVYCIAQDSFSSILEIALFTPLVSIPVYVTEHAFFKSIRDGRYHIALFCAAIGYPLGIACEVITRAILLAVFPIAYILLPGFTLNTVRALNSIPNENKCIITSSRGIGKCEYHTDMITGLLKPRRHPLLFSGDGTCLFDTYPKGNTDDTDDRCEIDNVHLTDSAHIINHHGFTRVIKKSSIINCMLRDWLNPKAPKPKYYDNIMAKRPQHFVAAVRSRYVQYKWLLLWPAFTITFEILVSKNIMTLPMLKLFSLTLATNLTGGVFLAGFLTALFCLGLLKTYRVAKSHYLLKRDFTDCQQLTEDIHNPLAPRYGVKEALAFVRFTDAEIVGTLALAGICYCAGLTGFVSANSIVAVGTLGLFSMAIPPVAAGLLFAATAALASLLTLWAIKEAHAEDHLCKYFDPIRSFLFQNPSPSAEITVKSNHTPLRLPGPGPVNSTPSSERN